MEKSGSAGARVGVNGAALSDDLPPGVWLARDAPSLRAAARERESEERGQRHRHQRGHALRRTGSHRILSMLYINITEQAAEPRLN